MTFHVKMPIFVARQWVRHRTGRMNEVSGRYSIMKDEFYVPAADKVAPQSKDNKQGRASEAFDKDTADKIISQLEEGQKEAYENYSELIDSGLAREIARINLTLSLYTEFYWEMDLHNLFHFLKHLRFMIIQIRLMRCKQMQVRCAAHLVFLPAAPAKKPGPVVRGSCPGI